MGNFPIRKVVGTYEGDQWTDAQWNLEYSAHPFYLQGMTVEDVKTAVKDKASFFDAVISGDIKSIFKQQNGPEFVNDLDRRTGYAAVHYAVMFNHPLVLNVLVECGASIDIKGPEGVSPIILAVCFGHENMVAFLLNHHPNLTDTFGDDTPLDIAKLSALSSASSNIAKYLRYDDNDVGLLERGCFFYCWVCPREIFLNLSFFPSHEVIKGDLIRAEGGNWSGSIAFISHHWLTQAFPDYNNIKIQGIQAMLEILTSIEYIWLDYLCIPQKATESEKCLAINSLPYYVSLCSAFVVIHGVSNQFNLEQQDKASLAVYFSRGWCRLECLAAFACKSNVFSYDFSSNTLRIGLGLESVNPLDGVFGKIKDRQRVAPMVMALCKRVDHTNGLSPLRDMLLPAKESAKQILMQKATDVCVPECTIA